MRGRYRCRVDFHFLRRIHCAPFWFIELLFIATITNRDYTPMLMTTIWAQRSPSLGLVNGRKGRRSQNGLFSMMMRLHVANGMCYTLYVVPRTLRLLRALLLPILHLERRDRSILAITIIVTISSSRTSVWPLVLTIHVNSWILLSAKFSKNRLHMHIQRDVCALMSFVVCHMTLFAKCTRSIRVRLVRVAISLICITIMTTRNRLSFHITLKW